MRFLKIIKNLTIYFDDFLVATDDLETHLKTIQDVLSRARECNVKFNVSKFQFLKKEIKFLGHVFSELGCQLDSSRIEAIQKLTAPTNVKQLQSVLGMVNYVRDFVPNMADLTAPLRILLKKTTAWHWSDAQETAFQHLKDILSNPPAL